MMVAVLVVVVVIVCVVVVVVVSTASGCTAIHDRVEDEGARFRGLPSGRSSEVKIILLSWDPRWR